MNDKIKHLLATAYKTDSIARNKWRIENREQLREQRKKELTELMEKDKTMSNDEFSSVEWLYNKMVLKLCNKLQTIEYTHIFLEEFEKAKEMQKQQHGKTWDDAMENMKARGGNDMRAYTDFDDYYAQTYGGNNV
jgi:hypothetical protein